MGNWTNLRTAIAEAITTNGNQEITGAVLRNTLNAIVNAIGANATFAGVATPTTNPGMPDGPVFYLAGISGEYSNFGVTLQDEIAVIANTSNDSWAKSTVLGAATAASAGVMSAEDKRILENVSSGFATITNGTISIDSNAKTITLTDIRVVYNGYLAVNGASALSNITYDFSSYVSATLPVNLIMAINPKTLAAILINLRYLNTNYKEKIAEGYIPLGVFRTNSNTLFCNVDKYTVDGVVYYNSIPETSFDTVAAKYYSLPLLDGEVEVSYITDRIIKIDGSLGASSLNVSDYIEALPGMVLHNLRTPGDVAQFAAVAFYDIRKNILSYYNGAAGSIEARFVPEISEECRYLRFTTARGTVPTISYNSRTIADLSSRIDAVKFDAISIIIGEPIEVNNETKAIIKIADGTLTYSDSYQSSVSDYISVSGYKKINLYNLRTPGSTLYGAIIGYDNDKNIITSYRSVNTVEEVFEYSIPTGVSYIRFTSNDFTTKYSIPISHKEKVIVIGSSSAQRLEKNSLGEFALQQLLPDNTFIWRGVGGENMQAITARSGITPLFPKANFSIPAAAGTKIEIPGFLTENKDCVFTSQQGANLPKLNPVSICGVEGNISLENSKFYFARSGEGTTVDVTIDDVIITSDYRNRDAILVAMLGYNGGYASVEEYVAYHEKARKMFNNPKFMFITRLCDGNWTNTTSIKDEESALTAEFGGNVLKLRDWLSRFGIKYAISLGLLSSETTQDVSDRESGYVPTSLRGDGVHLNNIGYQVLSYRISELLNSIL